MFFLKHEMYPSMEISICLQVLDDVTQLEKFPIAFSIPEEAAKKALKQNPGKAFLGVFRFPNMSKV